MNAPDAIVRVLIIDDDEDDFVLVRDLLTRIPGLKVEVDWAATVVAGRAGLLAAQHDVYLIDYRLGAESGIELVREAMATGMRRPLIVVTGRGNFDVALEALRAGATDYVVKDALDAETLGRVIRYALDRTRYLAEIAYSEERYRILFAHNPMPLWLSDPDTMRILEVNDAAIDLYGWSRAEFLAMTLLDLRPPEEREQFLAMYSAFAPGLRQDGLWRHWRKSGDIIEVEIVYYDLDLHGRQVRMVLSNDVTEQLRARRQVQEQEVRLRQILTDLAEAVLVVDDDGRVHFANPAAEQLFGLPFDRMIEDDFRVARDLLVQGDRGLATPHGQRAVEVRVTESVWEERPARLLTLRDVTERREAHERLLHSEQRLSGAMRIARMAGFERDMASPRLVWTGATEELFGLAPEQMAGGFGDLLAFIEPEDQAEVAKAREALFRGETDVMDCEFRGRRPDGKRLVVRVMARIVGRGDGGPGHLTGSLQDLTERRQAERDLAHLMTHDPVTDLPRFILVQQQAAGMIEQAERTGEQVVVFYIDLDRFHAINETLGHGVGDSALRVVAIRLRDAFGTGARVTRIGGDEFVAILPMATGSEAPQTLGERVRDAIEAPIAVDAYTVYLTCSIGFSRHPDNGTDLGDLLRRAEAAMSRAKRQGRNAVVAFSNEQTLELQDRLALGSRLRDAVRKRELILHFQPQVSARNGEVVGLEALVRWQSPDFGLVPPGRFIRVAEELGLIVDIGQWVLTAACAQARDWVKRGHERVGIAVNVSALQLQRPTFVDEVHEALSAAGLPARHLEIELTESAIMENVERMAETMRALKGLGVRLALDDFGIGYSSLNYLKRLPIDKLKVDQSFVKDITTDSGDAAIARAIIAMGHQLRMTVMAEGVETAAQLGYLRRNHCDLFQGYFFGPAVPAAEAELVLQQRFLVPTAFELSPTDRTLLLLDDEENVLRALVRTLRRDGYRILTAGSTREAFDILGRNDVQVIVSDQRMPDTDGTEFLSQVKEMYPDTVRLVLSGYTDLVSVTDAINRGAIYKFLTKPWDDDNLRAQIHDAFRMWSERTMALMGTEGIKADRP